MSDRNAYNWKIITKMYTDRIELYYLIITVAKYFIIS